MAADDDMNPPPEEIEMAMEEAMGHAVAGPASDRIDALQRRLKYLQDAKARSLSHGTDDPRHGDLIASYDRDIAEAEKQLQEWKLQHGSRN